MTSLAEVLDPAYVADLGDMALDDVRARRDEAQRVENGVSYLRIPVSSQSQAVLPAGPDAHG